MAVGYCSLSCCDGSRRLQVDGIEARCNQEIQHARAVRVQMYDAAHADEVMACPLFRGSLPPAHKIKVNAVAIPVVFHILTCTTCTEDASGHFAPTAFDCCRRFCSAPHISSAGC